MIVDRRLLGAALFTTAASAAAAQPADRSAAALRNEQIVRRYFDEAWGQGRLEVLDELLAADYVNHTPSTPDPPPGPGGLKPIISAFRQAFPDLRYEIEEVIATPDAVVARVWMSGTHLGPLFGQPASGKRVRVRQINIEHIAGGRIVAHWRVTDELSLMKQIGAI